MDILNYSPKSMSDMSVASNEQRMSTPLSSCTDANVSSSAASLSALASVSSTIATTITTTKIDTNLNGIEKNDDNKNIDGKLLTPMTAQNNETASLSAPINVNLIGMPALPSTFPNSVGGGLSNDDIYVNEFYKKISDYYRGIFSNIDIKDPNITPDVLNYYQLIRQFYEQTMAINIQRNTAIGLQAITTAPTATTTIDPTKIEMVKSQSSTSSTPALSDVSTIDLTIHKPPANEPLPFNNNPLKSNSPFQNNININIGSSNGDEIPKDRPATLAKINDGNLNDVSENKVTISSAGVSINVSSLNTNSLKISCKTTPPKKRYSVYNHTEESTTSDRNAITPKPMHVAPINLNRKFDVESLVTATATAKKSGILSDESTLPKSNFVGDAIRTNAAFESNKSSPVTSVDSASSITDIIPITSTYLQLMQSMGFSVEDAMKFDNVVS